jgi:hypothetical protein
MPPKVEAAVKRVEEYRQMGRDSLAKHEKYVPGDESSELLRKARVFAKRYTDADFEHLKERCREAEMPLGRTFIDRLATVRDKRKRRGLETRVIRGHWSLL